MLRFVQSGGCQYVFCKRGLVAQEAESKANELTAMRATRHRLVSGWIEDVLSLFGLSLDMPYELSIRSPASIRPRQSSRIAIPPAPQPTSFPGPHNNRPPTRNAMHREVHRLLRVVLGNLDACLQPPIVNTAIADPLRKIILGVLKHG